jgi:cobyrinic acid a,c-diamide synthase
LEILTQALAGLHIPILGVFRREDEISLPDRHLGLVPTDELPQLRSVMDKLAAIGQAGFNWELLEPLLKTQPSGSQTQAEFKAPSIGGLGAARLSTKPRIAVARDRAFNFYYADNLELLTALGAELVEWSPIGDRQMPEDIQGLYFGGGFPEMFAAELSDNQPVIQQVRQAIQAGMPTYAECGGLMYLTEAIVDFEQKRYPMVGLLPTEAQMGKRLTLGYRSAIAQADSPIVQAGQTLRGHEFHRSSLSQLPNPPLFQLHRSTQIHGAAITGLPTAEGWYGGNLHASYLHLHWGAMPELPLRWLARCMDWLLP